MAPPLEYVDEAIAEAEAAARWYAERSPLAAIRFSEELHVAENAIADAPNAWPAFHHGTQRYLLRRFPFSVIYRVETHHILIIAVAHGRRRPGYWESRTRPSI